MYGTKISRVAKEIVSKKTSARVKVDVGNGGVKWWVWIADRWFQDFFPHAVVELSLDSLPRLRQTDNSLPRGYVLVEKNNEQRLYAYGDTALGESMFKKQFGANRYRDGYYNILYWASICEGLFYFQTDHETQFKYLSVDYFASHAPRDFDYRPHIRDLLRQGDEIVTITGACGEVKLRANGDVVCNDEPLGGFYRYVFTMDGDIDKRLSEARNYIVLDGGELTLDGSVINNFIVNPKKLSSFDIGMGKVITEMSEHLIRTYPDKFRKGVNPKKVLTAVLTGKYPYGKSQKLPCLEKSQELRVRSTNAVATVFEELGGVDNFDVLLLTGGMTLLTLPLLQAEYGNDIIIRTAMPVDELEHIRFANLEGFRMVDEA